MRERKTSFKQGKEKKKTRLRAFSFSLLEPVLFQKREKRLLPHSSNTK
jgi:hypothetical protein